MFAYAEAYGKLWSEGKRPVRLLKHWRRIGEKATYTLGALILMRSKNVVIDHAAGCRAGDFLSSEQPQSAADVASAVGPARSVAVPAQ